MYNQTDLHYGTFFSGGRQHNSISTVKLPVTLPRAVLASNLQGICRKAGLHAKRIFQD
jgi:hypothetical protein